MKMISPQLFLRPVFCAFLAAVGVLSAAPAPSGVPQLLSPNGRIAVDIRVAAAIAYDVSVDERVVFVEPEHVPVFRADSLLE